MISVEDRGTTRSGKTYLPLYIDRVSIEIFLEFIERFSNARTVDVDSLILLMTDLTITQEAKPELPLGELI